MSTTFQELLNGVAQYYGAGSDQWANIARYGVNAETIPIIEQVPGVSITRSNSGAFLGYDYTNPFASVTNPASAIDSNLQTGAFGPGAFNAQLPSTAVTNQSTGITTMESGAKVANTGLTVAAIADKVSLAVAGVAIGTKLGKLIDSALYSANPEWWDEHYPTINPETWDNIATTQGGKTLIRSIFGLNDDEATMYIDERLLAYTYMMMLQEGVYGGGSIVISTPDFYTGLTIDENNILQGTLNEVLSVIATPQQIERVFAAGLGYTGNEPCFVKGITIYLLSEPLDISITLEAYSSFYDEYTVSGSINCTGRIININTDGQSISYGSTGTTYRLYKLKPYRQGVAFTDSNNLWGVNITRLPVVEGISDNPDAGTHITPNSVINPTTGEVVTPEDNVDDVLSALKTAYPDIFNDAVYEDVPQDDGTIQRITYIPAPYPNTTNDSQPVTQINPGVDPQITPQITPQTYPEDVVQDLTDSLTGDGTPTPPDTGGGNTPPAIIPAGSANALYSIYNPTQGELNSFGAWLWSSNFVDQLLKLFNDPMQAIIGLHKVFAQPAISGTSTIKVGYLDSGVSSNVVGNQYVTVDCGSVNVLEYFGNVFDYDPFTQVYIYLPFVGIEKLNTGDVMRGNIGVKYHVDVLTGACLAEITITRDGAGGILYTFAGNCAVQYPVSSGSYMGIVASLASIAGGVVGTVASGGALAPVAMGAVSGIMNAHTRVNHSGAFSGNAGAMGVKKPYLIITRPQTCLADNFPAFDGYPANKTTTISECSGFVKCEVCHVENVPATDAELSEIEMLLKSGVII